MLLLAASGLALTLAGCKVDNRPFLSQLRGAPEPAAYAALPQPGLPADGTYDGGAYPVSYLPPERAYPYAERAYGLDRAFYQAPPDYGFAYDGAEPWVWQAADRSLMFAEPYGDDYRFYYYEPGASYPYFVRDDRYGYAYGDNGALVALFDAAGALLGADAYPRYAPTARDYWSRGYDLRGAYARAPRIDVDRAVWSERAPLIARIEQPWMAAPERQPAWRAWRAAAGPSVVERYESERSGRAIAAAGRPDNGLHLGWDRGRRIGQERDAPRAVIATAPEPPRMQGSEKGWTRRAEAPAAMGHGRDVAFRAGEARLAPQAPEVRRGGEDHGRGHGNPHFAQAAPQAAPQAPTQARAERGPPQGQPQPNGGGDHGHGQGGGGGDKGGHGHGKGH